MTERTRPAVELTATCACGAVQVNVKGTVRSMLLCSCEDCQKASGSGHSVIAIVDGNDVIVTGATQAFERQAASGATFTRHFCPACGTPIMGQSTRWPNARMLPVGLFGGNTDWFVPTQLIFARSHRDWDTIAADLPRHNTYRQKREEH